MKNSQPEISDSLIMPKVNVEEYWEKGYTIVRGVFNPDDIAELKLAFDRAYEEGMKHPATWRHQNRVFWVQKKEGFGNFISGCQWQSWVDPVLDKFRTDPRMLAILEPLIGNHLSQIINQMHWKVPGTGYNWGMHQDVRSRTPKHCFRELGSSYVQTAIGVDRHWAGNGAMQIVPYSHKRGDLAIDQSKISSYGSSSEGVTERGVDMSKAIDFELAEGDVGLWGPYLIHGGGINTTNDSYRRLYINGYVKTFNCDRGQPVFHHGKPIPLTIPAMIQYEDLHFRPEPHYATDKATLIQRD